MSAEGPPSPHLHPHPIEVDVKYPKVAEAVSRTLNTAEGVLVSSYQRRLVHSGTVPGSTFDVDGWQPLLEIAGVTARTARHFDPNSPWQKYDNTLVSYMNTVATRNTEEAKVDWATLNNPRYFPGAAIPHGTPVVSYNLARLTKNLTDDRARALASSDHGRAKQLGYQIDALKHAHPSPSFDTDAANNFYDAYNAVSHPNHPRITNAEIVLEDNKQDLEKQTEAFSVLQSLGFRATPPAIGPIPNAELDTAQHNAQVYLERYYASGDLDRAEEVRTRENLQLAIEKLGNRNANTVRKVGSHVLDVARVIFRQGTLRTQHKKALKEGYRLAHDKEAFLEEHHNVLVDHTNDRAKWTIDHGMPSWLLRGNNVSKITRFLATGVGVAALAAVFIGAGPAGWVGIAAGGAAFKFDRKAHKKHRGNMKAGPNIDYSGNFNEAYAEMMRSYNTRLGLEYSKRFFASTLGAIAAWDVKPKEVTGRGSIPQWFTGGQAVKLGDYLRQRGEHRWKHDPGVIERDGHGHH